MTIQAVPRPDARDILEELGSGPIPAAPYYRKEYFELEREAIFRRSWLHVGHVCELPEPGRFIVRYLDILETSILITRDKAGRPRAFHNVCTHRGTQLVNEAAGKASRFTCGYHAWTFGNDGALQSAPDFENFDLDKKACGLRPITIDDCAGLIFVNLAASPAQSLRDYLGTLAGELEQLPLAKATTFAEYTYETNANWKVCADNFVETYHLRFIHPKTAAAGIGEQNPFGHPVSFDFHGPHSAQTMWFNAEIRPGEVEILAIEKLMASVAKAGFADSPLDLRYYVLFPNMMIQGMSMRHFTHTVIPISPTRSRGIFRFYWVGEDETASERFAREYSMAAMRDIHAEDQDVIESAQRGLNSGALEHVHFQTHEVSCRYQIHNVMARVEAYKAECGGQGT